MAYILGDITLPNPVNFQRKNIESSSMQTSITGRSTKDIRNRKEQFILAFQHLTQSEVSSILGEYNKETTLDFTVNETNLTVNTIVHMDIPERDYEKGSEYRENFIVILTEVI